MSDNNEKLMDLLQVLSARYPTDTDLGEAYQLAGELSCSVVAEDADNEIWQYLPMGRNCFSIVNPACELIFDVSALENSTAASGLEDSMKRLTRAVNGEAALKKRVAELDTWKREQLAIEAEWDAQAVAKLCNVPWGQPIRPAIEPTLIALKKRVAELEAKVAAQHLDLREVEKLLNAVHTVRKAVEVQSGRKMGENETFEDFVITHLGGVQLKADVAGKMMAAIEAMRVSGGSAEFQRAYDRALGLLGGGAQ